MMITDNIENIENPEKKILNYFSIDGAVGGSQDWFKNVVMHIGGCAAATACDCCVYLALRYGMEELYPCDVHHLTRKDYVDFAMKMKPYLRPRVNGVNKLYMFTDGFGAYLKDRGRSDITLEGLSGEEIYEAAAALIREQIGRGIPVPYLMLRHRNDRYKDFTWHWFLCYGYEERKDGMWIRVATYGESGDFPLRDLWDTGFEEKGGLIRIGLPLQQQSIQKEEEKTMANPVVTFEMENGDVMKAELYPEIAPNTVRNFISLVNKGFYDGLIFHRVIRGFMIQGGCPQGTGTGGPGYSIRGEFAQNGFANDLAHDPGVLSMARAMHPDSAGSQFFIMHQKSPHLDGAYAAFGKITEGMEVVNKIADTPTDFRDRPLEDQVMKKVTVDTFGEDYGQPETK